MLADAKKCRLNTTILTFNAIALVVICFLLYQLRPFQTDSGEIQDRITKLNIYAELRHNNLSASHDQLKNELESRMAILESRVKLLQVRAQ
ncbi:MULTISPECIES: hypothetical protein [unclassified Pseudomonas]|uniref:hypothetical protein n=1 Tax=unclassified Pseudomonas TaxID=196821 RepID=UPI00117A9D49|nr:MULTISPECIES: hypothetical protein [unclassified Pseudomonas]